MDITLNSIDTFVHAYFFIDANADSAINILFTIDILSICPPTPSQ